MNDPSGTVDGIVIVVVVAVFFFVSLLAAINCLVMLFAERRVSLRIVRIHTLN